MEEKISRGRFIRLGGALGVGAASASVLAACGGGGGESGSGGSGGGGSQGGGSNTGEPNTGEANTGEPNGGSNQNQAAGGGQAIAQTSEVAPNSAVKFRDSGSPALLVHLDSGDFVAYSAVCTHQGCTVAYQDGQLACPCHGSVFDPADGAAVVAGPAQEPLPEVPIEVRGGEVLRA